MRLTPAIGGAELIFFACAGRCVTGTGLLEGLVLSSSVRVVPAFVTVGCTAMLGAWCAWAALWGAQQHPVAPPLALVGVVALLAWAMWRPAQLWFLLPALLPVANFMPWTGWWLVDESDLLMLAVLGGSYLRWSCDAWRRHEVVPVQLPPGVRGLYLAVMALLWVGVWRGLDDARGGFTAWGRLLADLWSMGAYGDYDLPGNTLRVAKSLVWGLLLVPVLYRCGQGARLRLARGMVAGLTLVCLVVLWERCSYVGCFDFSRNYRTTAWFWEMHVGGAAIDVYVVLALPFAWWAAWSAPHGWRWYAAAGLVLLSAYAVLTTYSRGVYVALILTALVLAALARRFHLVAPDDTRWHHRAMAWLLVALAVETLGVLVGGVFVAERMARTNADLYQRMAHWQRGLGLLHTPAQWILGLGLGRLPAHYSTHTEQGALPGRVRWMRDTEGHYEAWLGGPVYVDTPGEFGLTQRVPLEPHGAYRVRLRLQLDGPVWLKVQLCERHLLYPQRCQLRTRQVSEADKSADGWVDWSLRGPMLATGDRPFAMADGVLSIKVLQAGAWVRLQRVQLIDPQGRQVLRNGDFAYGPRHWASLAEGHYLPWHMDNLFMELLIERGLLGLLVLAWLTLWALAQAISAGRRREPLGLMVGAAILAAVMAGMLVSMLEIPRVSIILWLLLTVSFCTQEKGAPMR